MVSIYAELHVGGYVFPILRFAYGTSQATDARGRVSAKVRRGLLHLTAAVPEHSFLLHWASDPHKRLPAQLILREAGRAIETVLFAGAYCVSYAEAFESGDEHLGSYICHFTLSDPDGWTWQVGGPTAYVAPAPREHSVPPVSVVPATVAAVAAMVKGHKRKARTEDDDLVAGTPEHKADRWERYKKKHKNDPQIWSEARWSKQYDANMRNALFGLEREREYTLAMGGISKTLKTPYTLRQVDIFIEDDDYCGQLKTGKVGLSKQAKIDLRKDDYLINNNLTVEYILEKGGSKPLLAALKKIGAIVKIGPQIP